MEEITAIIIGIIIGFSITYIMLLPIIVGLWLNLMF